FRSPSPSPGGWSKRSGDRVGAARRSRPRRPKSLVAPTRLHPVGLSHPPRDGEGKAQRISLPPKRKRAGGFPPARLALKAVSGEPEARSEILLDFDLGAGFFQLLLQLFSGLLRDVLDDRLRSAFDQVLGFLQTQVGADAADFLDDVDLLVAAVNQDNGELGLLFSGFSRSSGAGDSSDGDRSSSRDAPLVFQQLRQFSGFQDGQGRQFFNDFGEISHVSLPSVG